jgi:hypothetical protein
MNIKDFIEIVSPYSMTSVERITSLYNSLEYIRAHEIPGDIVECGVWKGGNIRGIIDYLHHHNMNDRNVWLYDTFAGMTVPEDIDVDLNLKKARDIFEDVKSYASLDSVKSLLASSNFPQKRLNYVVGDVMETLKERKNTPREISILRLDTDWYQSTKIELEVLYPLLKAGGVLIVDDYGHWQGAKKAVDEYFADSKVFVEKIDYTGVKIVKKC